MSVLDRYLLREWLKILGLVLCATVGLLLIQAFYDSFRDLIDVGANTLDILLYYAVALPGYFSVVLPISLLLSLLYVLGNFHRHNELIAIRAAGRNIFSTTRALWFAGLGFCGVSLLLNAHVVPWSVEASRRMFEHFQYRAAEKRTPGSLFGLVTGVTFDNQRAGRMWYMDRYSRFNQTAYGITVSELDRERRERKRLMAREARYDETRRAWVFSDGREMAFDPDTGEMQHPVAFAEKTEPTFNEDPSLMLLIDRGDPRNLSFFELRRIVDYLSEEKNPKVNRYAVRYYGLLADTLGPLIILAMAIPFTVAGVRVNPAVGVSKSIGLFFAYYVLNNFATILGGNGYMEPLWAAWLPNLAMTGLASFFFGRLR